MRWWMAVILAVVCVAVGLLVPLPQLKYERGHIPASKTAEPMANIGPANRTPLPQQTPQTNNTIEDVTVLTKTESPLTNATLRDNQIDSPWIALDGSQVPQAILLDLDNNEWCATNRANSGQLVLEFDANRLQLKSAQTKETLYEEMTGAIFSSPGQLDLIDWDFSADGHMAAIALGNSQSEASTMLYDLRTGDILSIENARMPRFSPDQASLYYIGAGEESALYKIDLPGGQAEKISPDGMRISSLIPLDDGIMACAYPQDEQGGGADEQAQGPPRLALLSGTGEVLRDYSLDVPGGSGQDFLLLTQEAGWVALQGKDAFPTLLIDTNSGMVLSLDARTTPIGQWQNKWLLRTEADEYITQNIQGSTLEHFCLDQNQ